MSVHIPTTSFVLATLALAGASAFAQAPRGTLERPPHQVNPVQSGGSPASKGEARKEQRQHAGMDMSVKAMDANGDGKVSRKEYDDYHRKFWSRMQPRDGMVSMDEMRSNMDAMMRGGPN